MREGKRGRGNVHVILVLIALVSYLGYALFFFLVRASNTHFCTGPWFMIEKQACHSCSSLSVVSSPSLSSFRPLSTVIVGVPFFWITRRANAVFLFSDSHTHLLPSIRIKKTFLFDPSIDIKILATKWSSTEGKAVAKKDGQRRCKFTQKE